MDHSAAANCTRRRFCGLLALTPLAACAAARAQPSAARLHAQGVPLLRDGQQFERAAALFAAAAQREPSNPAYRLALGCAYGSRAASLAYAAAFTYELAETRDRYPEVLAKWEAERAKRPVLPASAGETDSRPVPPTEHVFACKDDGTPFTLSRAQAELRLNLLCEAALAAWKQGLALSRTPAEKAHAFYIYGWGMRVLRRNLPALPLRNDAMWCFVGEPPLHPLRIRGAADLRGDFAAFHQATLLAPGNPLYWQAKGDASERDQQRRAYLKAIALAPPNAAALWYRLFEIVEEHSLYQGPQKWAIEQSYLADAQHMDEENAWFWWAQAAIEVRRTSFYGKDADPYGSLSGPKASLTQADLRICRRAVDLVMEGGEKLGGTIPVYHDSVPDLLAVAWRYRDRRQTDFARMTRDNELFSSLSIYAQFLVAEKRDRAEAERAIRSLVRMGTALYRSGKEPSIRDKGAYETQSAIGARLVGGGYTLLQELYETLGDKASAAATEAERAAFWRQARFPSSYVGTTKNDENALTDLYGPAYY